MLTSNYKPLKNNLMKKSIRQGVEGLAGLSLNIYKQYKIVMNFICEYNKAHLEKKT